MINHSRIHKKLQNLQLTSIIRLILYGLILTLPSVFYLRFSQNFQFPKTVFFQITIDVLLILSFFFIIRHKTISFPKKEPFFMLTATALLISFFASTIFSLAPRISFWGNIFNNEGLFQILHLIAWFFFVYVFFEKNHFASFLKTILISALFPSIVAIGQHIWGKNFFLPLGDELVGRSIGTLGHPNFLGQFLALALLVNIFLLLRHQRRIFFYILTFVLILTALATTGSRAGWITFGFGTTCLLIFFIKKTRQQITFLARKKNYFRKIFLFIIGSAIIFAAFFFILQRFNTEGMRSLESRVIIWQSILPAIKNMPLFGYGLDTFEFVYDQFKNPAIYEHELFTSTTNSAHNIILDILIQRGIFGFLSFLAISIFFLWKIYKYHEIPEVWFVFSIFSGWFFGMMFSFEVINHSVILIGLTAFLLQFTTEKTLYFISGRHPTPLLIKIFSRAGWKTIHEQAIKKTFIAAMCAILVSFSFFSFFINIRNIKAESALFQFFISSDIKTKKMFIKKELIFNNRQKYYLDQSTSFFLQNGFYANLSSVLTRALRLNNYNSYKDFLALAIVNVHLFQNMEKSAILIETAKNLSPNEPSLYLLWGDTLHSLKKYNEAVLEFEKYLSLLPPYWQWDDELDTKSFEKKEKYRKFFKIFPNFRSVFERLSESYSAIGNDKKAKYYRSHIKNF